jgi:hypothetical protein
VPYKTADKKLVNHSIVEGGFYQDDIAHVGEIVYGLGCKQCPAGSYVKPEDAPGKTMESCSACLDGKIFVPSYRRSHDALFSF